MPIPIDIWDQEYLMSSENSRWIRAPGMAERPDDQGRVLKHVSTGWIYILGRKMKRLGPQEGLEEAIEAADRFNPPGQWSYDAQQVRWTRPHWEVRYEGEGWTVWRENPEAESFSMIQASVAVHASADRARRWAELRLERTNSNLRGPVPRAGKPSTSKLPDVRVTEEEREDAFSLLGQLELSYAAFVRASFRFAEEHLDGGDWMVTKEGSAYAFRPRPALEDDASWDEDTPNTPDVLEDTP